MKRLTVVFNATFLVALFVIVITQKVAAQNISGIINSYTKVTALDSCQSKLTVSGTTGFTVGGGVVILQMNGSSMLSDDNVNFGTITDLRKVGYFEANVVDSIAGNEIFLRYSIANIYFFGGVVQLVTYPTYTNAVVTDTLKAKPWDGNTGGVLAFQATQLTLQAPISATGVGFRGGSAPNPFTDCVGGPGSSAPNYVYSRFDQEGGPKGEGVAPTIDGKENGRGAQGNGGGGGNNHNAGGGGGGNVSAGGLGGRNREPALFGCYGNNPGLGSYALQTFNDRLYMGGGGGAGHDNNRVASAGGNGGGIIIIKANNITATAARNIVANGADALESGGDGGGGGGGGGSVLLESPSISNLISVSARGGNGGNANNGGAVRCQGPGGGGGGGRIMINGATVSNTNLNITGGNPGNSVNSSSSNCPIASNGGLAGAPGVTTSSNQTVSIIRQLLSERVYRTHAIVTQPTNKTICVGKNDSLKVVVQGQNLRYQWQIDNGSGFVDLGNDATFSDVNSNRLLIANAPQNISTNHFRCVTTGGCVNNTVINSNSSIITITPRPTAAFVVNTTAGTNVVSFTNNSLNATSYRWQFGTANATSTAAAPTFTYPTQGNYTATLTAYNNCDSTQISFPVVLNSRPVAGFEATTTDYCIPAQVRYLSQASQNAVSWRWSFPGGVPSTSSDTSPVVTYPTAGIYDVSLIVTNPNGNDTLTRASYVRVNGMPNPQFTWIRSGTTVSFTNPTTGATNFLWNFGNGQTSTTTNPQINFPNPGTYIVSLTATNACGTATRRDTLQLLGFPVATLITNVREGCSPLRVQYAAQNPTNVTNWRWTFPNGSPASSTVQNPLVTYSAAGVYSATLIISNATSNTTYELNNYITVRETPRADFTAAVNGTVVEFNNRSFGATSSRWDFGNGDIQTRNDLSFTYLYNRNGLFTVTLTVTNPYCGAATSRPVAINYTDVKAISEETPRIDVFPNPTSGVIQLKFENVNLLRDEGKISLISAIGETLSTFPLTKNATQQLDISDLPSGIYWLKIEGEKLNSTTKIVKY